MLIPRIIHQTVRDKSQVDDLVLQNIRRLIEINQGWTIQLYDESDCLSFIDRHYGPEMMHLYHSIAHDYGPARADLFRYLLIYEVGGVYLDIKSTIHKSLNETLDPDDRYILSRWKNGRGERDEAWGRHPNIDGVRNEFQQWHIASTPKHPYLRAVIDRVTQNIKNYDPVTRGVGKVGVMRLTGPIAYTSAIQPIVELYPHRIADAIDDLGFQYSIFPATRTNKYGHIALFKNHYSTLVTPIIGGQTLPPIQSLLLAVVTQYRLVRRRLRDAAKDLMGRTKD